MRRTLATIPLLVFIVFSMVFSACNCGSAPTLTPSPTYFLTPTAPPTPQPTPTLTPTPTPTRTPSTSRSLPATPAQSSPGNGINVPGSSITFHWSGPSGATVFQLEVNTDQNWSMGTRFYYQTMTTNSQTVTGFHNNGTTYYWRVWAGNANGWSAPTSGWRVVNGASSPPATPSHTAPKNATSVPATAITFRWSAPSGATVYQLEVNTDQNWGTGTRFYYRTMTTNSQTVTGFPDTGTTYYWRVWAGNANGWSSPAAGWRVVNGASGPPSTPGLSSPADRTSVTGSSITFTWSAPSGAAVYQLEVNTDQNWGNTTRFYYKTMSTNSQTVTGFPDTGTTYYWRVWAGNANGWSAPTSGWSVVNGASSPVSTPALSSPADRASVTGSSITFRWTAPSGATVYQLEMNTDQNWGMGTRFYYQTMSTNSQTVTGFPNNGTTYYWRVWAGNSRGWSAPTTGSSLVNGRSSPPETPALSSPADRASVTGSSITFRWSAPSGATVYQLEVNTDQNWGTGTRFYYKTMSANSQRVTGFPNNGTTYYWRVWAGSPAGWSAPTPGRSVTNP